MENDVLKNKIAPWQEKGRWYHITAKSDGSAWSIIKDKTDERFKNAITIVSGYFLRVNDPKLDSYDEVIVDIKFKFNTNPVTNLFIGGSTYCIYLSNLVQDIVLGGANIYIGELDIYIFVG